MAYILNIDVSTVNCSVCLSFGNKILAFDQNFTQNDHATWIHASVQQILVSTLGSLSKLNAVSVVSGPGSYTGLRIGLATAKGICFAAGVPLILINTLEFMAFSVKDKYRDVWFCPMIDARRMEVYTCLFDQNLNQLIKPAAMILGEDSFMEYLEKNKLVFLGNGIDKYRRLINNKNAIFDISLFDAKSLAPISLLYFSQKRFSLVESSEPFYIKDVYINKW